ncbi:MAG: lamin tail domain-containing protein [Anaerolineae bacterium]
MPRRSIFWPLCLLVILCLAAVTSARGNLLTNPGFEAGKSGWVSLAGSFEIVSSPVHGGASAAKVRGTIAQYVDGVYAGAGCSFTAWAVKNDPAVSSVRLVLDWKDAGGNSLRRDSSSLLSTNSPDYRQLTLGPVTAPAGAKRVQVILESAGSGYSFFDDTALDMTSPPPTATTATTPTSTTAPSPSPTSTRTATVTPSPTALPAGALVINELLYQPAPTIGTPEAHREWAELYNALPAALNLRGFRLSDGEDTDTLPAFVLPAGGFAVIVGSRAAFLADYPGFAGLLIELGDAELGNGLNNAGDALILRDPVGRLVDALSYGDDVSVFTTPCPLAAAGHSLEREPAGWDTDRAEDFVERETPSPGGTPAPTATLPATPTATSTHTATATPSVTPTSTSTAAPSSTPSAAPTAAPSSTPTATPEAARQRCFLPLLRRG